MSGTEDPIESMPSSMEAKEIMERAINEENIDAYVHGPLAFDNAISPEAAEIKNIKNEVAGKADIILVPNLKQEITIKNNGLFYGCLRCWFYCRW